MSELDKKISEFVEITSVGDNAVIPVVQGNPLDNYKITVENLLKLVQIPDLGKEYLSKINDDIAEGFIEFLRGISVEELATFLKGISVEELATFLKGISVEGLATFAQGLKIGDFQSGIHAGQGGAIDSAGNAELESLVLRSFLDVPTIRYNELEYIGEEIIIGAGAVLKDVEHLGDDRYLLTLKLEDGQFNPFRPSDLLKGIYNMDEDGNFTGFGTTYVSVSSIDEHEMIVILADESDVVGNRNTPPRKFMHLARIGNFTDADRQSYISLSAKDRAITQYGGVNAFAKKNKQGKNVRAGVVTTQWGRAEGLEFIENFDNLPITKDSDVLYTDTLLYNKLVKVDYQGVVIKEYIDRGQWVEGMECQVTHTTIDEVWVDSEKFRLIDRPIVDNPFVTTKKPTRESEDWTLILSIKDNIEIGGRNLLISSNLDRLAKNFTHNTTKHLKARINYYFNFIVELEPNTEYVVSNKKIIHDGSGAEAENTLRLTIFNEAVTTQKQPIGTLYSGSSISFKTNSNITHGDMLLFYPTSSTQIDFEVLEIKLEKGTKATDWTPAPEDVQASIDAVQTNVNTVSNTVSNLNTYIDGAFKDGVIDTAEAKAIEKYKNTLNETMSKTEASYLKVYANTYLEGTAKTALLNAKINLCGQRDTLLATINSAIADGKTTVAEKNAVDSAFNTFNNLMSAFQSALEEANRAIQKKLDDIAKGYVDDIEIGGRNLTIGTTDQPEVYVSSTGDRRRISFGEHTFEKDVQYTASFDFKVEGEISVIGYNFLWGSDGLGNTSLGSSIFVIKDGEWHRYSITFSFNNVRTGSLDLGIDDRVEGNTVGVEYEFRSLKLEKGTIATDWTPAPEDTEAEIQLAKAIPYQAGEYKAGIPYVRYPNSYPIVSYGTSGDAPLYYALKGDVGTNKQPNLPANNTIWESVPSFKQVFTEVLFAEFAKLDSFVFNNGKMFSQEGTLNGVAGSVAYTNKDHEPNFEVEGISGKVKMKDADIEGTITGSVFTSKDGKIVVDGRSNQIVLKDEDSDAIRTILSPRKLPLTPSSYFGSSSPTNVSLGTLQKSYSKNSSSVDLITIPAGDSSAYQITIPPITMNVNVSHPGDLGGGMIHMNSASIEVGIYKGGILQYIVGSVSAQSAGAMEADTRITPLRSFTIQGSGTWSVRVTHRHTINQYPSNSTGNVTNINGNAAVAKVVNSSAIGSNGMIIATSGTEYTYMVGDTYEVRRGNVGFRITDEGIQKSSNMDSSYPTWNPI